MNAFRWMTGLLASAALVGCGSQASNLSSLQARAETTIVTPTQVITGFPPTCAEAAPQLGLTGTFEQAYIDTTTIPAGPVDIGNGATATLTFQNEQRKLFSWTATTPISFVMTYGNALKTNAFVYTPPATSEPGLLGAPDGANVAFVKLCYLLPEEGCTLTQGYWKTHSVNGPAPYDETWAQIGETTPFFNSGKTWYQVLWTAPAGNAYYILAHQYVAAALNVKAGVSLGALQADFDAATALFTANTSDAVAKADKAAYTTLADKLAAFNEGKVGPGHCDDVEPSTAQ